MNNQDKIEDKKESQEDLKNLEEKSVEEVEKLEEEINEELPEAKEQLVEIAENEQAKPKNIHDELISRVDATKEQAQAIYDKYITLNSELEEKSSALINQENSVLNTTVANSLALLKELQVQSLEDENATIGDIKIDNKEQLLNIKYPNKGRFGGFLLGAVATVAGVAGAYAYGSKLLNLPLSIDALLSKKNWDSIALKYGELINIKDNAIAGYLTIGVASLILGAIVYKIFTILKASKNKKYVNKLEEDLNGYVERLEEKNSSIKELIEHIDNIKLVMQKYDIILQEQNAKLKRILFIEKPQSLDELQRASKLEVDKTVLILDELLKLMNTPVSDNIDIKIESKEQLQEANGVINEIIKKLYV